MKGFFCPACGELISAHDIREVMGAIISAVETCRRLKILVRNYTGSVLPGMGDFPVGRIAALTPTAWASRN